MSTYHLTDSMRADLIAAHLEEFGDEHVEDDPFQASYNAFTLDALRTIPADFDYPTGWAPPEDGDDSGVARGEWPPAAVVVLCVDYRYGTESRILA